jgi:hypothetical protein
MPRKSSKEKPAASKHAPHPIPLPPEYYFLAVGVKGRALKELQPLSQRWLTLLPRWPMSGAVQLLSAADFEQWRALERDLRTWGKKHGRIAPDPAEGIIADPLFREAVERSRAREVDGRNLPPLKGAAEAALEIIRAQKGRGLVAKEIVKELKREGFNVEESTFRRHHLPQLKIHGIKNDPARGGYYDARSCSTGV